MSNYSFLLTIDLIYNFSIPEVRTVVYCYGFRYHDDGGAPSEADFDDILALYGQTEEERERDRLRDMLACASEMEILEKYAL